MCLWWFGHLAGDDCVGVHEEWRLEGVPPHTQTNKVRQTSTLLTSHVMRLLLRAHACVCDFKASELTPQNVSNFNYSCIIHLLFVEKARQWVMTFPNAFLSSVERLPLV